MTIAMTYTSPNRTQGQIQVDNYPDTCPLCHKGMNPMWIAAMATVDAPVDLVDAAFQCTSIPCRRIFIGTYRLLPVGRARGESFVLVQVEPMTPIEYGFSEEITKLSPTFVKVYNQSIAAEAGGLDQLAGMGLRKALEFLVKDFGISETKNAEEKEQIKKTYLGPCIDKYITDVPVQKAAKKATWLGNDETHYVRKWEDQDITDLKNLLRLTVNAIENVLLAKRYDEEIPS